MRYPLIPISAAFAAGVWAAPHFYLTASEQIFFASVALAGAAWLLLLDRSSYALIACLTGIFLCGTFLAADEHWAFPKNSLQSLASQALIDPEQPLQVSGWVRTPSVQRPYGEYFDFEVSRVQQAAQTFSAEGAIRVYYFPPRRSPDASSDAAHADGSLDIKYGTRLSLALKDLRRPRNFGTPGAFDYESYMRHQGLEFTGLVPRQDDVVRLSGRSGNPVTAGIYALRSRLLNYLNRRFSAGTAGANQGAILKAILLGDASDVDEDTQSAFQQSGMYHILIVSGMHVAALAFVLFWMLTALRVSDGWSTVIVSGAVILYAALAGAGVPVQRATLIILVFLGAKLIYRRRDLLNSVAGAGLLLLFLHPSNLRDESFDLSFFAALIVAGIAVPFCQWTLTPYVHALVNLDDRDRDRVLEPRQAQFRHDVRVLIRFCVDRLPARLRQRRWLEPVLRSSAYWALRSAEGIVFMLLLQAGFSLATVFYFHRVAWSGLVSNAVVAPLIVALIPAGFLVLAISLISWPLASIAGGLLGLLAQAIEWVAKSSAHLAALNRRVPTPPDWFIAVFLSILLILALSIHWRSRWLWAPGGTLFVLCFVLTLAPYAPRVSHGKLELTALDVGQGDALFLAFPEGKTMLVDSGQGPGFSDGFHSSGRDLGEEVVSTYLWSRQIKKLDIVVATHPHWDHIGGLRSIFNNFHVGQFWVGDTDPKYADLLRFVSAKNVPVRQLSQAALTDIDGVNAKILWPPSDWMPVKDANNDSVVLRLGFGRRHILLSGDAESTVERKLLKAGAVLQSDILKVPHHGSGDASSSPFLASVSPGFGVISVGLYNSYGHPRAETLDRLRQARVDVFRTHRDGATTILTDGNRIEVKTYREEVRSWPRFLSYEASRR